MALKRCLEVTVGSTSGLKESRSSSKDDPYAVVRLGEVCHRTHTGEASGMRPVWNHRFTFFLPEDSEGDPEFLELEIWDREQGSADKQLGFCKVTLKELYEKCTMEVLQSVHRKSGKLLGHIRLHLDLLKEEPPIILPINWHHEAGLLSASRLQFPVENKISFLNPTRDSFQLTSSSSQGPSRTWSLPSDKNLQKVAPGSLLEHIQKSLKNEGSLWGSYPPKPLNIPESSNLGPVKVENLWQSQGNESSLLKNLLFKRKPERANRGQELYQNSPGMMSGSLENEPEKQERKELKFEILKGGFEAQQEEVRVGFRDRNEQFEPPKFPVPNPFSEHSTPHPENQLRVPKPPPLDLSVVSNSSHSEISPSYSAIFQSPTFAGLLSPALWSSLAPTPNPTPPGVSKGRSSIFSERDTRIQNLEKNQENVKSFQEKERGAEIPPWLEQAQALSLRRDDPQVQLDAELALSGGAQGLREHTEGLRGSGLLRSTSSPLSIGGKGSAFRGVPGEVRKTNSSSPGRNKRASSEDLSFDFNLGTPGGSVSGETGVWKEKRSRFTS